ncbi:MAG TPA: phosphate-starvation-inducible PsiE family protein [Hyphomicrobiaceae bacterium]|nr:phosphate-starvation-inducible PsiE family protein [Hyphomicrobiaceae bacterium]
MVRKFIIIDASHVEPLTLIGLALATLALGCVYWLIREQERR